MKKTSIQLAKYIGVGGTAALVEWSCFALLIGPLRLHYLPAAAICFVIATAVNYILSVRFVFSRGRHPVRKEFVLLYLVSAVGLMLNILLMSLFVGMLAASAMRAKISATGVVFFWNFGARKFLVFK